MTPLLYEILDAPDKRLKRDEFIGLCIHHTGVNDRKEISDDLWSKLSRNITNYLAARDDNYVSAHYTIWRDGKISQLVNPATHEAFHAGKSSWYNPKTMVFESDCNKNFVGIELVGDGNIHGYSYEQYESLIILCRFLKDKFPIHPQCIVSHSAISPGRKTDPGILFNWTHFFTGYFK